MAGCDLGCKTFSAINELQAEFATKLESVPVDIIDGHQTFETSQARRSVTDEYRGTLLLFEVGRGCMEACAISRHLEENPRAQYGIAVQEVIENLGVVNG